MGEDETFKPVQTTQGIKKRKTGLRARENKI